MICNDGYTIERYIHGMEAEYNDVATWRYRDVVTAFGGAEGSGCRTYAVQTPAELSALLDDPDFNIPRPGLRFVEVYMPLPRAPGTTPRWSRNSPPPLFLFFFLSF